MSPMPYSLLQQGLLDASLHLFLTKIGRDLPELIKGGFKATGTVRRNGPLPLLQCCDIY
jgi:hypothetical protein